MYISAFKKIRTITVSNLRHNFLPHLILSVLLLLMTPFVFGTANVDVKTAAIPLEMFVSLIGIILITPVFLPEQQENIRDAVESKATSPVGVYVIRIGISLLTMLSLITMFVCYLKGNGCAVNLTEAVYGTFSGGVFLGALGLLAYSLSRVITVGYMVPIVYYMLNLFGAKNFFGNLYLFSMSSGSMKEKHWLFATGLILIAFALLIRSKAIRLH